MTVVIIGTGAVARDLLDLLTNAGFAASHLYHAAGDAEEDADGLIAQASWIIDASGPDPDIQRQSIAVLAGKCATDAIISADVSIATLAELTEGLDADFTARFAITHFFIPTRYLKLVELVTGSNTAPATTARLQRWLVESLDRHVIACADTPGFIANRIGLYPIMRGLQHALQQRWHIAQFDAAFSAALGTPRLGCFGLVDLIGFNVLAQLANDLQQRLPQDDPWRSCNLRAIEQGIAGIASALGDRFTGFYKRLPDSRVRLPLDLTNMSYDEPAEGPSGEPPSQAMLDYVHALREQVRQCAADVATGTGSVPGDINAALTLGFSWQQGPFEWDMMDMPKPEQQSG